MQIFLKYNSTVTLNDVQEGDTIGALKQRAAEKLNLPPPKQRWIFAGKIVEDSATVAQAKITAGCTIIVVLITPAFLNEYDQVVAGPLKRRLEVLASTRCFVFIGLGSYHGGGNEESIRRQQCPRWVLDYCKKHGLTLHILLVDGEYGSGTAPQIYNLDAWDLKSTLYDGKVRNYSNGRGYTLSTYATNVLKAEYDGITHTLAEVDLDALGKSIATQGGCLVSGNFFEEEAEPHVLVGWKHD